MKRICSKFKQIDIFGRPVSLCINEKEKFKSHFGAFISIIMMGISLYFTINLIIGWFQINNSTVIYSNENYSVTSILNENRSIEYVFDNKNYYIYFAVYAILPDKSELTYTELERYFNIEYRYGKNVDNIITTLLQSESCYQRVQNEFLGLNYNKDEVPEDQQASYRMCVKTKFLMGMIANPEIQGVLVPSLNFQISQCKNSTTNNNYCASEEEIKNMSKYVMVQASIPKTIYDFKNTSNPIKRMYKYEYYYLDWEFQTRYLNELNPNLLYLDYGLFNDDYIFHSLNFNPDKPTLNINMKNKETNMLFQYKFVISYQVDKYYIRNQKLNDIIESLGGIISILFNIGALICFSYNNFYLDHLLINSAFRFEHEVNLRTSPKIFMK